MAAGDTATFDLASAKWSNHATGRTKAPVGGLCHTHTVALADLAPGADLAPEALSGQDGRDSVVAQYLLVTPLPSVNLGWLATTSGDCVLRDCVC